MNLGLDFTPKDPHSGVLSRLDWGTLAVVCLGSGTVATRVLKCLDRAMRVSQSAEVFKKCTVYVACEHLRQKTR